MTGAADVELLPLLDWMGCLGEISAEEIRDYARACVAHATAAKDAEIARERWLREQAENRCVAVEDQREALRDEVERLKTVAHNFVDDLAEKDTEIGALRAEVQFLRSHRPIARKLAEAEVRAEQLAEALRGLRDLMLEQVKWEPCDCGCPQQRTPDGPHSVTWLRAARQVEIAISKAEGNDDA